MGRGAPFWPLSGSQALVMSSAYGTSEVRPRNSTDRTRMLYLEWLRQRRACVRCYQGWG